jgi:response regulator RpfG family c-di-GMP phosphodiesterase
METKPRLLYIDDEVDNLTVFKRTFNKEFDVTTAISAKDALALLEDGEDFCIIVSDQKMPDITGAQFFQKIQADKATRILLTGYADMQAIIDAVNQGRIYFYCTKPWNREELKLTLAKALEYFHLSSKGRMLDKLATYVKEMANLNKSSLEVIDQINKS